jgi:uncharacterized membrane protein (Fun14 family)
LEVIGFRDGFVLSRVSRVYAALEGFFCLGVLFGFLNEIHFFCW